MQALLLFGVVLAFINTQKPNFMNILLKIYFMNFDKTLAQSTARNIVGHFNEYSFPAPQSNNERFPFELETKTDESN